MPKLSPEKIVHAEQSIHILKQIPVESGEGWKIIKKVVGVKDTGEFSGSDRSETPLDICTVSDALLQARDLLLMALWSSLAPTARSTCVWSGPPTPSATVSTRQTERTPIRHRLTSPTLRHVRSGRH